VRLCSLVLRKHAWRITHLGRVLRCMICKLKIWKERWIIPLIQNTHLQSRESSSFQSQLRSVSATSVRVHINMHPRYEFVPRWNRGKSPTYRVRYRNLLISIEEYSIFGNISGMEWVGNALTWGTCLTSQFNINITDSFFLNIFIYCLFSASAIYNTNVLSKIANTVT